MRSRPFPGWGLVLAGVACQPELSPASGHFEVSFETDAPLPSKQTEAHVAAFDAVAIDVLETTGSPCAGCSRELPLTRERVDGRATFTVTAPRGATLRVRLFASRHGQMALDPARVVERWVRLPPAPAEGAAEARVTLPVAQVGSAIGSFEAPTAPDPVGPPMSERAERSVLIAERPGTRCIREALFWMGSATLLPEGEFSANEPRLVSVSPFCVDASEVTVSELRGARVDTTGVIAGSNSGDAEDRAAFCTYSAAPGPNEDRPVNCVPWATARAACRARGGDLPSEAELELLASSLGRWPFVWGVEPPTCADAFFGRAAGVIQGDRSCNRDPARAVLPSPASLLERTRDRLALAGGPPVLGLAGNLSEWTREAFAPTAAGCGRPASGVIVDPECAVATGEARISIRGGSLSSPAGATAASVRAFLQHDHVRADVGFRCVYR